jgi:hypothetical protein
LVAWVGLYQIKNEQLFAFSHHENGIAGYKDFLASPGGRVYVTMDGFRLQQKNPKH